MSPVNDGLNLWISGPMSPVNDGTIPKVKITSSN